MEMEKKHILHLHGHGEGDGEEARSSCCFFNNF